jgi:hypothetical protein
MLKLKDNDGACFHTLHFKDSSTYKYFLILLMTIQGASGIDARFVIQM